MVRHSPWVSDDPQKIRSRPLQRPEPQHDPGDHPTIFLTMLRMLLAPRLGRIGFLLHIPLWGLIVWRSVVTAQHDYTLLILFFISAVLMCRRLRDFGFSPLFWAVYAIAVIGGLIYARAHGELIPSALGFRMGHMFSLPILILLHLLPGQSRYDPYGENDD